MDATQDDYMLQAEILLRFDDYIGRWITPKRDRQLLSAARVVLAGDVEIVARIRQHLTKQIHEVGTGMEPAGAPAGYRYGETVELLGTRLAEKGVAGGLIDIILDILMMLFAMCPFASTSDVRFGPLRRARLAREIREKANCDRAESFRLADLTVKMADDATDTEVQGLIYDCCS